MTTTPRISRGAGSLTADVFNRTMRALDNAEAATAASRTGVPLRTFLAKITSSQAVNRDLSPGDAAYQAKRYIFQYSWEQVGLTWRSDASTAPAIQARTLQDPRTGTAGSASDNRGAFNLIEIQNTEFRIGPGVDLPSDDSITVSAVENGTLVTMHQVNDPSGASGLSSQFYYFSQDNPVSCDDSDGGAPVATRVTNLDFGTFISSSGNVLTFDLGAF